MDCSSLVWFSLINCGNPNFTTATLGSYPFATSTMGEYLIAAGWTQHAWTTWDDIPAGAILVTPNKHTEVYLGKLDESKLTGLETTSSELPYSDSGTPYSVGARSDENGGRGISATGGDQKQPSRNWIGGEVGGGPAANLGTYTYYYTYSGSTETAASLIAALRTL